jgi:uncharacterized membrane protein YhaH (DUF805 family)
MEWYLKVLRNWNVFQGRARRQEYWMFYLIALLTGLALLILQFAVKMLDIRVLSLLITAIVLGYSIVLAIAHLSVSVRRLHDTGKSGWWLLMTLIPFVGPIIVLVFLATDGFPGENQYGPNPKAAGAPQPALG